MNWAKIRIEMTSLTTGDIWIDDHKLNCVSAFTVNAGAGNVTRVDLTVIGILEFSADRTVVSARLTPELAALEAPKPRTVRDEWRFEQEVRESLR